MHALIGDGVPNPARVVRPGPSAAAVAHLDYGNVSVFPPAQVVRSAPAPSLVLTRAALDGAPILLDSPSHPSASRAAVPTAHRPRSGLRRRSLVLGRGLAIVQEHVPGASVAEVAAGLRVVLAEVARGCHQNAGSPLGSVGFFTHGGRRVDMRRATDAL